MRATRPWLLIAMGMVMLFVPQVAAQSTTTDVRDGGGETVLATLDLLRLRASATADVVEVRLDLARTPATFDAESLATLTAEFHYVYEVEFQVRSAQPSDSDPFVLTLGAIAWFSVHPDVPCPCWAGVDWRFTLDVREGVLGTATGTQPRTYPVNATLDGDDLVWKIDREVISRGARVLSPDQGWTLSEGHARSRFEGYVVDATTQWATDRRPGKFLGEDRAPDEGHTASFLAPRRSTAQPLAPLPQPQAPEATAKPSMVTFNGRATGPSLTFQTVTWTAALAAVVALLRPRLGAAVLAGLFSRFLANEAVAHPRRAMIYEALGDGPATFSQLRTLLEMGSGPLAYHLGMLERHKLIESRRVKARRVYCLRGQASRIVGFDGPDAKVLEALRTRPGLAANEVGAILGVGRAAALYHLERLERGGRVRSAREGRTRRFFVA